MAAKTVHCAKLNQDLPGLDPASAVGDHASKFVRMIAGRDFEKRVLDNVSEKAWAMWEDHMVMVFNEYRLDPMSDESNKVLKMHMEAFFFGEQQAVPNYVPPKN